MERIRGEYTENREEGINEGGKWKAEGKQQAGKYGFWNWEGYSLNLYRLGDHRTFALDARDICQTAVGTKTYHPTTVFTPQYPFSLYTIV
jgi:hypothetical protein